MIPFDNTSYHKKVIIEDYVWIAAKVIKKRDADAYYRLKKEKSFYLKQKK